MISAGPLIDEMLNENVAELMIALFGKETSPESEHGSVTLTVAFEKSTSDELTVGLGTFEASPLITEVNVPCLVNESRSPVGVGEGDVVVGVEVVVGT